MTNIEKILHFVEFGTYLQCLPIHVEIENVQFFILFFFHFLFFFGKGYEKANSSTQMWVLVIFVPKKSWGNFTFLNSRHHPSIHPFSQKKWMEWTKGTQGWVCNGH